MFSFLSDLLRRERLLVEQYLGESSGSAVDAARRARYQWRQKLGPRLVENSREKWSSGSHQYPKRKRCRFLRSSITAVSPASHSLTIDFCSRATRRSPLATACVLWLRFRPAGSGTDDSTSSCNKLCVDSGLASFCTFCGAGHSPCDFGFWIADFGLTVTPISLATCHSPLATPSSLATTCVNWLRF